MYTVLDAASVLLVSAIRVSFGSMMSLPLIADTSRPGRDLGVSDQYAKSVRSEVEGSVRIDV